MLAVVFISLAVLAVAGVIVLSCIKPAAVDWHMPRTYFVNFRQDLPPDNEFSGEPMIFRPVQRGSFYLMSGLLWFMVLLVLAAIILIAPWQVKPELFKAVALIWGFAFIMALLVTAIFVDEFCATLCIYENGLRWRSPLRTKNYCFHQLESLRIGRALGSRVNRYEFMQNGRSVLKLPMPRYDNLLYLERIFTSGHPCVASVVNDRPDTSGT